jgi:adenylate cyclase
MESGFGHGFDFDIQAFLVPEISSIVDEISAGIDRQPQSVSLLTGADIGTSQKQEMATPDYMVAFSGMSKSFCVGIVDMANSTKISASLNEKEWCKYYGIFLNSMSKILYKFGGVAIKNGGDSLLFYFPRSGDGDSKVGSLSCLECGMAMLEAQPLICKTVKDEGLPPLDYRVSSDFGKVVIMKSNNSSSIDLIGPPLNMCAKINHKAQKNGMVIGGDLYQLVRDLKKYRFSPVGGLSIGLKFTYPVYSVSK